MKSRQIEMVSIEELVEADHPYRKYGEVVDFEGACVPLAEASNAGRQGGDGYGVEVMLRVLLLQFMEDLSDREMERFLRENVAAKWFCGFGLSEKTPDFTSLSKARTRIGPKVLSECFATVRGQLKAKGHFNEVFTFVDAECLDCEIAALGGTRQGEAGRI